MAKKSKNQDFESYWDNEKLVNDTELITGCLRINIKYYEEAYVSHPDGNADVFIEGQKMRNRALNGDIVYVQILPKEQWKIPMSDLKRNNIGNLSLNGDGEDIEERCVVKAADMERMGLSVKNCMAERFTTYEEIPSLSPTLKKYFMDGDNQQKFTSLSQFLDMFPGVELVRTGKVVGIKSKVHSRKAAGIIRLMKDKSQSKALFVPRDGRMPRMVVMGANLPSDFFSRPGDYEKSIFMVRISRWKENANFPIGQVCKGVGRVGEIAPETEALLMEFNVDATDFSKKVIDSLRGFSRTIPAEELAKRRDFRHKCVFTIDPDTARDLDDAVSCEILEGGRYEVGVHIADVSYYVKEDTPLDEISSQRAFSVYLVQKVVPMLPSLLCEELCSLNPGVDRLTFSVVWVLREDGSVEKEWIGRSVIRSCAKFAYRHVQGFIDHPDKEWSSEELPETFGGFSVAEISRKSCELHKITSNIKKTRMEAGSLRLDQTKLSFSLDVDSGFPNVVTVYERTDSHFLIEELMLKANTSIAEFILAHHPNSALLRCHPPPTTKGLENFNAFCAAMNLSVDSTSAGALQESFREMQKGGPGANVDRFHAMVHHCLKSMQQAMYIASGDKNTYRHHYALNFPCYTHFTSPIRRYADLLVHRQLCIALGYEPWRVSILTDPIRLKKMCEHINVKKTNAKSVGDKSVDLYFTIFLRECGPMHVDAVVIDVQDKSFDVLVGKLGVNKRIRLNKVPLDSFTHVKNGKNAHMELVWLPNEETKETMTQKIAIFTQLKCRLLHVEESFTWDIEIKHPLQE